MGTKRTFPGRYRARAGRRWVPPVFEEACDDVTIPSSNFRRANQRALEEYTAYLSRSVKTVGNTKCCPQEANATSLNRPLQVSSSTSNPCYPDDCSTSAEGDDEEQTYLSFKEKNKEATDKDDFSVLATEMDKLVGELVRLLEDDCVPPRLSQHPQTSFFPSHLSPGGAFSPHRPPISVGRERLGKNDSEAGEISWENINTLAGRDVHLLTNAEESGRNKKKQRNTTTTGRKHRADPIGTTNNSSNGNGLEGKSSLCPRKSFSVRIGGAEKPTSIKIVSYKGLPLKFSTLQQYDFGMPSIDPFLVRLLENSHRVRYSRKSLSLTSIPELSSVSLDLMQYNCVSI